MRHGLKNLGFVFTLTSLVLQTRREKQDAVVSVDNIARDFAVFYRIDDKLFDRVMRQG